MDIAHLVAFNVALLAAIASPGPALLVAIRTTLVAGRASGIAVGLGLGLVAASWTLAALLGLEAVFLVAPWAHTGMKIAGGLYLVYIAVGMWRGAREPVGQDARPARHAFRRGLAINALNPKSAMFAAAVLVVIFPPDMRLAEMLLVAGNHLVVEIAFYTLLAVALSRPAIADRYLAAKVLFDRMAAGVLGVLGLRLLTDRPE